MGREMSREKVLETLGMLALVSVACGLYFRLEPLQYAAAALLTVALFFRRPAAAIASGWMRFGHLLGTVNTRILLAAAFYLVLTPLAILYRLLHKDTLQIRPGGPSASLWHVRDHTYKAGDFENLW